MIEHAGIIKAGVLGFSSFMLPVAANVAATSPNDLATKGVPYVLAVLLFVLAKAIVAKDSHYRTDLKAQSSKHAEEMKAQSDKHAKEAKDRADSFAAALADTNTILLRALADSTAAMQLLQASNDRLDASTTALDKSVSKCHTVHKEMTRIMAGSINEEE